MHDRKAEIVKIMGKNLRKARLASNLTIKEVNNKLFNGNGNRLSEIEHGVQAPTLPKLVELVQLYGVSLDYIFGLSTEYEMNIGCAYGGLVLNTMREASLDMAERITEQLIQLSKQLPNYQAQMLIDSVKKMLKEFMRYRQDMIFQVEYANLDDVVKDVQYHLQETENIIARQARLMELSYIQALEESENQLLYPRRKNDEV